MTIIEAIKDWWQILSAIGVAIGGVYRWYVISKNNKQSSSELLYTQLESLKKQVISQVAREVSLARDIGERDKIIEGLRQHCPECYAEFMDKYRSNGTESGTENS